MKKLGIVAATMLLGTSAAFAASLAIPWFVDQAPANSGLPHSTVTGANQSAITTLIFLKSNRTDTLLCSIEYFDPAGNSLGPSAAQGNTFTIAPRSALAFRPFRTDPGPAAGGPGNGMEGTQAVAVPNSPGWLNNGNLVGNGSATITWSGGPQDVQGAVSVQQTAGTATGDILTMSYGHLLPPGV